MKYQRLFSTHAQMAEVYNDLSATSQYIRPFVAMAADDPTNTPITMNRAVFYLYHTSDCTIEMCVAAEWAPYSHVSRVKEGYVYGGILSDYGGAGETVADILSGDTSAFANTNTVTDVGGTPYDGSSLTLSVNETTTRFFKTADYLKTGLHPQNGMVYFLKEVPIQYYIQAQYLHYLYNSSTHVINTIIPVFNIDDTNYESASMRIFTTDNQYGYNLKSRIASSLTVQNTSGNSVTLRPNTVFGRRGYLCFVQLNRADLPGANSQFYIDNTIVTFDHVEIHSFMLFSTGEWTVSTISKSYTDTRPTLTIPG